MKLAKGSVASAVFAALVMLPLMAQADIISLAPQPAAAPTPTASPLSCFNFLSTLAMGSKSYDVRGLQFALMHEGFSITPSEYGMFGTSTLAAVNAFQQKYASDVLQGLPGPTGLVGKMTRAKLNSLYGCGVPSVVTTTSAAPALPASVVLSVKDVSLDINGVTVVVCNNSSSDIPVFPLRIRLNGIIRDFNVLGALKTGICDSETVPYGAWGLTYDPSSTYGVVTSLDPNSMYKTSQTTYPLVGTTTLVIPTIQGAHLAVRGLSLKSNGVQGTLCNLGTSDLASFPVRITVNGTSKDIDVASLHAHGQCQTITWTYDMFGIAPAAGSTVTATVNIDPNNIIQEINELENSATISGSI